MIYDSDRPCARLIGVEFVISDRLNAQLPADEQAMWHSHELEVKSGQLTMPRMPAAAELPVMAKLVTTYGQTWHFWQVRQGERMGLVEGDRGEVR